MKQADLLKYIVHAPLYKEEILEDPAPGETPGYAVAWPTPLDRQCEECGLTKWDGHEAYEPGLRFGLHALTYHCRNCKIGQFSVWLSLREVDGVVRIMKAGQMPKPGIVIGKEFGKALGARRELYIKGMTSRHNGYGIGAVPYLRRLIEETTDEMLAILEESMKATNWDPTAIAALQKARGGRIFEDKVRLAAEVIPTHLRPGGVNPFGVLYDLLSIGLHDMDDRECCDVIDAMDRSLTYIYTRLKVQTEDIASYKEAVGRVQNLLAKAKERRGERT